MLRFQEYGALPPFANAENKRLDEEVRASEAKLTKLSNELDDNVARTTAMADHMRNVQQELTYVQQLYDARNREIETEEHLKAVADREMGRLSSDLNKFETSLARISDQASTTQNHIYRVNEKVAKLKASLSSEQKELEDWLQVQCEKEEDNLILFKYSKEDDQRIKDLTLQIEKLMGVVNRKRNQLNQEMTETQVSQIELEKTTDEFRKMHRERQELLVQWEAAVDAMRQRDQEIVRAQENYRKLLQETRSKQLLVDEKEKFLKSQLEANRETEKSLESLDRTVSNLRANQQNASNGLNSYQDEVDALKTHLNRTSNDILNKRNEIKTLRLNMQERKAILDAENENVGKAKLLLSQVMNDTDTKEEKAAKLQAMLLQDEARDFELDKQIKLLKEQTFKKSQDMFKLSQEEKTLQAEISGAQANMKNLQSKINRLDQDSLKQQALLYNQEYALQQLERKVRRAQGDRTEEEKQILNKRIEELNTILEVQNKNYTLINTQLKQSQDDLRQTKRKLEALTKEKQAVSEQIDSLDLYNTSAAHQLTLKVKEKEEVMVEVNILRLEFKKTRGFLNARADEVFSLKSRQIHLRYALEERIKEIEIHKDMLKAQVKIAEEERYSAAGELRERVNKVDKMKRRYEILMSQFGGGEGDEEKTQASYIIKAAQEREELQRSGDQFDCRIQKAEKEIKALENTLTLMNSRNDNFRDNLQRVDLMPEDIDQKQNLEQQLNIAMDRYRQKRRETHELQQQLMTAENDLANLCEQESGHQQTTHELETRMTMLIRELNDQEKKRERAWLNIMKLSRDVKRARGVSLRELLPEEIDMQLRETKELTNMIFAKLAELMLRNPDLEIAIQQLYQKAGIQPPSRPATRFSSYGKGVTVDGTGMVSDRSSSVRDDTPIGGKVSKPPMPNGDANGGIRRDGEMSKLNARGRPGSAISSRSSGRNTPTHATNGGSKAGIVSLSNQLSPSSSQGKLNGTNKSQSRNHTPTTFSKRSGVGSGESLNGRKSQIGSQDLTGSTSGLSIGGTAKTSMTLQNKGNGQNNVRMTGLATRVKRSARPGSASSESSRGSAANLRGL